MFQSHPQLLECFPFFLLPLHRLSFLLFSRALPIYPFFPTTSFWSSPPSFSTISLHLQLLRPIPSLLELFYHFSPLVFLVFSLFFTFTNLLLQSSSMPLLHLSMCSKIFQNYFWISIPPLVKSLFNFSPSKVKENYKNNSFIGSGFKLSTTFIWVLNIPFQIKP